MIDGRRIVARVGETFQHRERPCGMVREVNVAPEPERVLGLACLRVDDGLRTIERPKPGDDDVWLLPPQVWPGDVVAGAVQQSGGVPKLTCCRPHP